MALSTNFASTMIVLLAVIAIAVVVDASTTTVSICPREGTNENSKRYHGDKVCNREAYNRYKGSLDRYHTINHYKALGGISTVANQKTLHCPLGGTRVSMKDALNPGDGLDTVWFVENKASTPVVVAYVTHDGMEVSVKNTHIVPAVADPSAIIAPGGWMAVYAYEGHEFVVRQVLGNNIAGNVLMQHRAGMIPVGASLASSSLSCPEEDVEPKLSDSNITRPEFRRSPTEIDRPCHTIDVGFRNVASCPLHGYWVGGEGSSCREEFKLHLGVEKYTGNFQSDWVSNTKHEGTFIGHTFHFRLASNPSVLVESVTLAPVVVTDCPTVSVKVEVSTDPLGVSGKIGGYQFSNSTLNGTVSSSAPTTPQYYFHSGRTNSSNGYTAAKSGGVGLM